MRRKKADEPKKIKLPAGTQARHLIEAQTAAFINGGGRVNQIPNGVSGQKYGLSPQPAGVDNKPAIATG